MTYTDELRQSVSNLERWSELPFFSGQPSPFARICEKLEEMSDVKPAACSVFKALQMCSPRDVRVVVLGLAPYPDREHATGLAFSVPRETCPLPLTLRNISEEMRCDLGFNLNHGDLTNWASQGVLLLNSVLTKSDPVVRGWDRLITDVFCRLRQLEDAENIFWVFLSKKSWGLIPPGLNEQQMLKTHHPVSRHPDRENGFFGSKPFSKINCFFEQRNGNLMPINWQVPA